MIAMMDIQIKKLFMLIIMNSDYQDKEDDFLDEKNFKNYNWKQTFLYYYHKPWSFFKNLYESIISFKYKMQSKKLIN